MPIASIALDGGAARGIAMSAPHNPRPPAALPPSALLSAWLEQSHDLLALTDAAGRIHWSNAAFERAAGIGAHADLLDLAPIDWHAGAARRALLAALHAGHATDADIGLRSRSGAALWVQARVTSVGDERLWTLRDTRVDDTRIDELTRSLGSTAARLRLAVDLGRIVSWRHDLKTNRVHYNDHGFAVVGIPPRAEGLALEEVRALTHPDDVPKVAAAAARALQTDTPVDVEARYLHADGSWRHLLVRRVVERGASGEALAFVGVSLDVTDQVEQARRAAQLARRLESAAEAARVGIWTTTIGSDQTEWNAQMFELFDMVGASRPPTLSEWLVACVHPDDAERVAQTIRDYLHGEHGAIEIEFRIRLRNGSTRWVMVRADLDRSSTDATRLFGIAMDVTDRHDALVALHAASARAALIARHAGIGTWENDEHGSPAIWDEQMFRLRGLPPRATALDHAERLAMVHPDDRHLLLDTHPELHAGTRPTAYEFRVRLPDGSYRWLASRTASLCDEHGKVVRRVGVNWDITDAKNAELARQHALLAERESHAKSEFLSRMSHELRTPLNAVLGFTQLLQIEARQARASGQLVKLDHIHAAGEQLLALINDALDLSSLEAGTLKLDLQPVPLAAAVAQALPQVAALANGQRVSVRSGRLEGAARADPARLQQVLLNLLTNAVKYNRPGGQVVVESSADDGQLHLRVRDTGRGIPPEQLVHLFEPFNRLGIEGEGVEGSGIGLTIVKALVEGMGGRIGVSSQPGQGTVFELALPAADAPRSAAAAPARRERTGQLLYIEDNSVNVLLVEELVKSLSGLRIVSEATGTAGVARARTLHPDVILIDMQLPDFDGFEVLRQLRAAPETAATPCIALSANALPEDIERGLAHGFDDYWTKPIQFKAFLDALERLFPVSVG